MLKKLFITLVLVMVSSVCFAAVVNQVNNDKEQARISVCNELSSYKNLTNLQKAQLLVSHKSIDKQVEIKKKAYFHENNKTVVSQFNQGKSKTEANVYQNVVNSDNRLFLSEKLSELSFSERLKAKYGLKSNNVINSQEKINDFKVVGKSAVVSTSKSESKRNLVKSNKLTDSKRVVKLKEQLKEVKANEVRLKKENYALKNELRKVIAVMENIKGKSK